MTNQAKKRKDLPTRKEDIIIMNQLINENSNGAHSKIENASKIRKKSHTAVWRLTLDITSIFRLGPSRVGDIYKVYQES